MIVRRWQAPVIPTQEQIQSMLLAEGLKPLLEEFKPGQDLPVHTHPFDEVRMIIQGAMIIEMTGNRILLRAGDRIHIPSNTKHSKKIHGTESCLSYYSPKVFIS